MVQIMVRCLYLATCINVRITLPALYESRPDVGCQQRNATQRARNQPKHSLLARDVSAHLVEQQNLCARSERNEQKHELRGNNALGSFSSWMPMEMRRFSPVVRQK